MLQVSVRKCVLQFQSTLKPLNLEIEKKKEDRESYKGLRISYHLNFFLNLQYTSKKKMRRSHTNEIPHIVHPELFFLPENQRTGAELSELV